MLLRCGFTKIVETVLLQWTIQLSYFMGPISSNRARMMQMCILLCSFLLWAFLLSLYKLWSLQAHHFCLFLFFFFSSGLLQFSSLVTMISRITKGVLSWCCWPRGSAAMSVTDIDCGMLYFGPCHVHLLIVCGCLGCLQALNVCKLWRQGVWALFHFPPNPKISQTFSCIIFNVRIPVTLYNQNSLLWSLSSYRLSLSIKPLTSQMS